jgi:hypothetical protein
MTQLLKVTKPKVIPIGPPAASGSDHDAGYEAGLRGEPKDETKNPDWKTQWTEAQK